MSYKFNIPPPREIIRSEALEPGDYSFIVADANEPYQKENGNWVCKVQLIIEPSKLWVWAYPWSGVTKDGEPRDQIAEFLLSCNRAPKVGTEPDWYGVINARGRCRLEVENPESGPYAGRKRNIVAYFYVPKEVGPEQPVKTYAESEVRQAAKAARAGDTEPDEMPF